MRGALVKDVRLPQALMPEVVLNCDRDDPGQRGHNVEATGSADVMVVVGTSAIVYPAAGLPDLALARGTAVIEVNPEPTPLSGSATISIRESASQALPGLLERLPALLK
ncbi:NAD-dependent deacetylase [Mycobacterium tuberculosis]|nr:NAD-dependent deacetylase [Mycobacterium tuberculosis]